MYKVHRGKVLPIIVALIFVSFLYPSYAKDIYKWVDKNGTLHYTDDPKKIPEEKKGEAKKIEGGEENSVDRVEVNLTPSPPTEDENSELNLEQQRQQEEAL